MQPTSEQLAALDLFETGETFAIEAGAGTGKTSTLRLLAASTDRRGQYVAFNKAIVEEAKEKFPANVACNTAHSLAVRYCGSRFASRKNGAQGRMKSSDIAKILRIEGMTVTGPDGVAKYLSPSFLAGVTMRAVNRFCQTADPEPTRRHVPYLDGLDATVDGRRGRSNNDAVARYLEPAVRAAWADWQKTDGTGRLPFTLSVFMTVCLKTAQLEGMTIGADFILFDECQDANPVLVAIVEAQTHAQIVWVGDSQQQIYAFTGAVNALGNIAADRRTYLTQSFRFGPDIADEANEILSWIESAELRLKGLDSIDSVVDVIDGDPVTVLTRTNATAVREVLRVQAEGKRPFLVGGAREIVAFAEAAAKLMQGERVSHPELACFSTWGEVQEYVEDDEQGDELRLLVALVDEFGVETIVEALNGLAREDQADVIVSTAHKSKGREWNRVRIASDFPDDREKLGDDEKRLLYVAVTRAKLHLDISAVAVLSADYDDPERAAARAEKAARQAERRQAREQAEQARVAERAERPTRLEEGRYEIVGEVVSTKTNKWGRPAMLVRIDESDLRVFGDVPERLGAFSRGDRVAFVATVERSDTDETFGFFKSPEIVGAEAGAAS